MGAECTPIQVVHKGRYAPYTKHSAKSVATHLQGHPLGQPRGAPRYFLGRRRARVPRLRCNRALRGTSHLRAYPRRHRGGEKTPANAGPPASEPGDGFRRSETHRCRLVARSSGTTARDWQGNGLQNRRRNARGGFRALNVILGTNGHGRAHRPPRTMKMDPDYVRRSSCTVIPAFYVAGSA